MNAQWEFTDSKIKYTYFRPFDEGDINCTSPVELEIQLTHNYSLSFKGTDQLVDVFNINTVFETIHYTPRGQAMVDWLNTEVFCGYDDWQLNVAKELAPIEDPCITEKFPFFDLITIKNSKIYFGDYTSASGRSQEQRPSQIDWGTNYSPQ
ncbi:MAG: hypothetical protein HRT45_16395 [Bdellovibrionales bacterium]|nr:hypothetical protein [Bdellovibrionales bacterium]